MQLDSFRSIRNTLALATAALISEPAVAGAASSKLESTILLYSETDRVSAVEGAVELKKEIAENQHFQVKVTFDGLTGATPSGATPSRNIQTYTRPSGNGSYTVPAGQIPLDDTFHDTRTAVNASYSRPLDRFTTVSLGGNASVEYDYRSLGLNLSIARDFNRRNTTVSLALAASNDVIKPEGGIPIPFAAMAPAGSPTARSGSQESKDVYDLVVGLTQILDRNSLVRLSYSNSRSTGYLKDPFKVLSVLQPDTAGSPGEPTSIVYENRPDRRTKQALFGQLRRYLGGHTVDVSYRYFWDNWGVRSHTIDLFFLMNLKAGRSIQPHLRWYHQGAADFYRAYLVEGEPLPAEASADYRLAAFNAITVGLQYAFKVYQEHTLKITAEYYKQIDASNGTGPIMALQGVDLYPDTKAIMLRLGYGLGF